MWLGFSRSSSFAGVNGGLARGSAQEDASGNPGVRAAVVDGAKMTGGGRERTKLLEEARLDKSTVQEAVDLHIKASALARHTELFSLGLSQHRVDLHIRSRVAGRASWVVAAEAGCARRAGQVDPFDGA